jgi:hypothetical protein
MRQKMQIAFDCSDPASLASFYAEALNYKVQDPPKEFKSWEEAYRAWGIAEDEWNSWSAIVDSEGSGPRIFFQKMETPKLGKNRLHVDINASEGAQVPIERRKEQVAARVQRLLALGARQQSVWEENGEYWIVMLDPEGNEFCVQ